MAQDPGNIGKLVRFLHDPCAPSWQVLAEATLKTLPRLFLTLAPIDLKGSIHALTGKSWLCHVRAAVTDADAKGIITAGDGLRFAFWANEIADWGAWYGFLASVAGETAVYWTSQVWKFSGCHLKPGTLRGYSDDPYPQKATPSQWGIIIEFFNMFPDFGSGIGTQIDLFPGESATLFLKVRYEDGHGGIAPCSSRLIVKPMGQILDAWTTPGGKVKDDNHNLVWGRYTNHSQDIHTLAIETSLPGWDDTHIANIHDAYFSLTYHVSH